MCGIAGFTVTDQDKNYPALITDMTNALAHRGPNARANWHNDSVFFGHARLSIIDLSESSNQPMHSSDNRYVIIYNGELYNYKELRLELQRVAHGSGNLPYFFQTNSDTEVIIAAYQRWGETCLEKFNGMFAFALLDKHENKLFMARDRLGVKPLYYSWNKKCLVFASEIRSVLSSGLVERKISRKAVSEYLSYQTVHAPNTIIEDINVLMPGHFMVLKNNELSIKPYWNINSFVNRSDPSDYQATCKTVKELLFKAVERRLVADVPFGAFLSGGIDSSAVVGIMSQLTSQKTETFNISFDESEFSEAIYARKIAAIFNTNHHEIKLSPDIFLDQLPEALSAMDHPSGDGPNTYVVSKATKQAGITMALSGLGGDELFAGYDVFKRMTELSRKTWMNVFPVWMRKIPAMVIRAKKDSIEGEKIYELLSQSKVAVETAYPITRKTFSERQLKHLIKENSGDPLKKIIQSIKKPDHEHLLSYVSALEICTYLQNVLLRDTDQMSMAVALEVREPFLDHNLLEFVLSVKDDFKYPFTPKKLMIDSLEGLLPEEIINRPKMGFTLPWKNWLKNELRSFCEENIKAFAKRDFLNGEEVVKLWNDFLKDDKKVTWSRVWHLVVLENWLQKNNIH